MTNSTKADLPKWLNSNYFHDILIKNYQNYKLKKFLVENALGVGENYASVIYRCSVELELKDGSSKLLNYIVKVLPENEKQKQIIDKLHLFAKEIQMYGKYVGKFENLYKLNGVNVKFSPKAYKLATNALILEDLKRQNYKNAIRQKGLDLQQTEKTLEKMAKFHSSSVCVYENEGSYPDIFFDGQLSEKFKEIYDDLESGVPEALMECIKKWGSCYQYIDKISKFLEVGNSLATKALKYNPNNFNVLNHGDLWVNNIMFKFDENEDQIVDLQFVDLQMCKWGSPALDIIYFIITSCSSEIKVKYFDYFIKYYHDHLINNLKLFNYSQRMPSLIDLHCEIMKCGHFAVYEALILLPLTLLDPSDNSNFESLFDKDSGQEYRMQVYSNPRYIKAMEELLPFFDNRGFFDFN